MATKLDDFTKEKQATTQEEVDAQDARTRLYQSLGYTYGQQMEDSDKQYDKAISQQDRTAISHGMQRSSFNLQTQANLQNQKVEARNKLGAAMIADYQKQATDLEESAANRALQKEQFQATQDYNYAKLAQQKELTEAQMAQNQTQFDIQQAFSEKQWEAQQAQWREEFDYNKMTDAQKIAYNYIVAAAEQGGDVSDELLARAGISREDYNAMKKQASSGGGGGSYTKKTETETEKPTATDSVLEAMADEKIKAAATPTGTTPALKNYTSPNFAQIVGSKNNGTGSASTPASTSTNATGKNITSAASTKKRDDTYYDYAYEVLTNSKKK